MPENMPENISVSQAIQTRISCRAFLNKDVAQQTVREIIERAQRAPSGGNLQPWIVHVLRGNAVKNISNAVINKIQNGTRAEKSDYDIYPPKLPEPYRSRRFRVGEMLYADLLNIPRENKTKRLQKFADNYRFFGAPVAMFFSMERYMREGQWADLGMFIQTIMLVARDFGLHTCPQECWAAFTPTVRETLKIPDNHIFFCGLALGYMDIQNPANKLRTERANLNEFAHFIGFDE